MKFRAWLAAAIAAFSVTAFAQQPIKIGMSMPQTGGLGAGGKSALLALQMWVEDVNAKGGLLGRKVQFISYDDQTNASLVPGIYTKLLDVDKVDLLIAPYGTNVTAPIMPLVKQRDLLLMGNFSFDVNAQIKHDKWFNNAPWGAGALAWGGPVPRGGGQARRQDHRRDGGRRRVRAEPVHRRARHRQGEGPAVRLRPELSAQHGGLLLHHPRGARGQARHRVHLLLPARVGRHRARR
jgi:hypothetical protein